LALANNPEFHDRSKHIDIHQHWIREQLAAKKVHLEDVHTGEQVADVFTKPLAKEKFQKFREMLGLRRY
jgi:hypothetical protein